MQLTPEQLATYNEDGYLTNLPLLAPDEVREAQEAYHRLLGMMPDGVNIWQLSQWEKKNDFVYRLATHPQALDYAESLCGPDFYVWDAYFFAKPPRAQWTSQMHTDMGSWPMSEKGRFATLFLAITDTTVANGCLDVVRGSHREGHRHIAKDYDRKTEVFHHEVPQEDIDPDRLVHLELKAGEISMHHQLTVHGSGPNNTDDHRVGLALRYASCDTEANLHIWPQFSIIPVRGEDRHRKNPVHPVPTGFGVPGLEDDPIYRSPALSARLRRIWRKVTRPGGPQILVDRTKSTAPR